jgi:TM2 domain-containing membrane protein YozV
MKDKTTAGILALLVGGIGVHKFYLGKIGQGILYFLFSWTFIPSLIAFFEGIKYLTMEQAQFDYKYNPRYLGHQGHHQLPSTHAHGAHPNQARGPGGYGAGPNPYGHGGPQNNQQAPPPNDDEIYERLEKLNELRVSGVISEEEFAQEKQRLLSRL